MSQPSDQTDLHTDSYSMTPSAIPANSDSNTNRKKVLGISAAALLLGGSAWAISRKIIEKNPDSPINGSTGDEPGSPESPAGNGLPDDIDVAGKVNDNMSFEQAFAAARDEVGMGGVFGWHGHWYNTFEKEEWSSLSLEQRQSYTEMITGEKLPVQLYVHSTDNTHGVTAQPETAAEPTIIEGHINGQRVMGLDFDQDGIIDTLVMDGADGYTYRVVDASGDDGLDTLFRYDSLNGELTKVEKIDEPFMLTNDQFSQGLEASMSKEVVDSILEPEIHTSTPLETPADDDDVSDESDHNDPIHLASSYEPDDDTYINNGDVQDMDE